jgi:hypothetical protein
MNIKKMKTEILRLVDQFGLITFDVLEERVDGFAEYCTRGIRWYNNHNLVMWEGISECGDKALRLATKGSDGLVPAPCIPDIYSVGMDLPLAKVTLLSTLLTPSDHIWNTPHWLPVALVRQTLYEDIHRRAGSLS